MLDARAEARIRATITRVLKGADGPRWLSHTDLAGVLEAAEISLAPSELTSLDAVESTAERLGYPLVAKAVATGLIHKSDIGGVILGLQASTAVKTAAETLVERCSACRRETRRNSPPARNQRWHRGARRYHQRSYLRAACGLWSRWRARRAPA
jgi:acyl-CoA synthetase (NDP forming)